jgi:3-oxoacyl-[acyl-carrier protein] reductase
MPMKSAPASKLPLQGQVAVITGAGRGIGRAIALNVAELGAHAVLCGRSRGALAETAALIKGGATGPVRLTGKTAVAEPTIVECDVTNLASVESLSHQVESAFHRLDILVNNAGIAGPSGPLHQLSPSDWDDLINTNLRGAYYCIRSLVPLMMRSAPQSAFQSEPNPRGGHIINISSLAGKNPLPNGAAYAASKWGLQGLTYSVADELRAHHIRVSVICPGSVHTDFSLHPGRKVDKMLQATDVSHVVAMLVTQTRQSFASEILLRPTEKP